MKDERLYAALGLVDALPLGRGREVKLAEKLLVNMLKHHAYTLAECRKDYCCCTPVRRPVAERGVAPLNCDSVRFRGTRRLKGGRANVRRKLYMAAVVSLPHNEMKNQTYWIAPY